MTEATSVICMCMYGVYMCVHKINYVYGVYMCVHVINYIKQTILAHIHMHPFFTTENLAF